MALKVFGLDEARAHARSWLFEHAAPLWIGTGISDNGLFAERIDLQGNAVKLDRRLRVQARQIYSFCVIGSLGWTGPWEERVTRAVDVLVSAGRRQDGLFGHLFNDSGTLISEATDLYDHAFGLFALAHAAKALKRDELYAIADDIQTTLDEKWWRPEGGYWEGELTPCPPYRQNPHMHMFEAALAHFEATGLQKWRARADRIAELFLSKFQEPKSGAVTEYFDADWSRIGVPNSDVVEPGHCLEWAWLFEVGFAKSEGANTSNALTEFARNHGIDRNLGVAINEVKLNGETVDGGARLWPQTERLKAALARYKRTNDANEANEAVAAYNGLLKYLDTPVPGLWRDRLNSDGSFVEEAAPASSFYHIVCGISELLK